MNTLEAWVFCSLIIMLVCLAVQNFVLRKRLGKDDD